MSLQDKIASAKPSTFLTDGLSKEEVKQAVDEGRKRTTDTVKLIIEIPKESYEYIKIASDMGWLTSPEYANAIRLTASEYVDTIKNGTLLDSVIENIKTEIMSYKDSVDRAIADDEFKRDGMKIAYQNCIEIIDEHLANMRGE